MRRKVGVILGVMVLCFCFAILGYGQGINSAQPVEVRIPVYYLDQERIDRYQDHIAFLHQIIDEHEAELNSQGKLVGEQQDTIGILSFKVALYEEMTHQVIDVRIERR